ncbi:DoxX family protein [Pontibacter sp. E15-1]|uniref:DoxX family protein n=1 Tax=Pontibacter sp. E15-1 TaxID=2919918 RepID=UPI001F4F497E|nr:DoxX family protein [Pontibacter sp. E15-1]MCJ8164461.1 DoxX family protein [Pontibacter sp. E15-1]
MALFRSDYSYRAFGLLLLRIGIGTMFILHGWPKLAGGIELWENLGKSMEVVGIDFAPAFWGFMAGFSEAAGGLLLALGLFWRPVCLLLFITMVVATLRHVTGGDPFNAYSHALEAAILFFAFLFIGPGGYSLDRKLFPSDKYRSRFNRIVV